MAYVDIHNDQILIELFAGSNDLSLGIYNKTATVKNKFILPTDKIHVTNKSLCLLSMAFKKLFSFFEFADMRSGVAWRHVWYKESEELGSEGALWEWGSHGQAHVFFSPVGGFTPGRYMVQIYVGGELKRTGTFVVR